MASAQDNSCKVLTNLINRAIVSITTNDDKYIITGYNEGIITVFDRGNAEMVASWINLTNANISALFVNDNLLYVGNEKGDINVYDLSRTMTFTIPLPHHSITTSEVVRGVAGKLISEPVQTNKKSHSSRVISFAYFSDKSHYVSYSSKKIIIWNSTTLEQMKVDIIQIITSVAVNKVNDDYMILVGTNDGSILAYKMELTQPNSYTIFPAYNTWKPHSTKVSSILILSSGSIISSSIASKNSICISTCVFLPPQAQAIPTLEATITMQQLNVNMSINTMTVSSDDAYLIFASDNYIYIYEIATQQLFWEMSAVNQVKSIVFQNNKFIATSDDSIYVCDFEKIIANFDTPDKKIAGVSKVRVNSLERQVEQLMKLRKGEHAKYADKKKQLEEYEETQREKNMCIICLEPGADNLFFECGHLMHHNCGNEAIRFSHECPRCRDRRILRRPIKVFYEQKYLKYKQKYMELKNLIKYNS